MSFDVFCLLQQQLEKLLSKLGQVNLCADTFFWIIFILISLKTSFSRLCGKSAHITLGIFSENLTNKIRKKLQPTVSQISECSKLKLNN